MSETTYLLFFAANLAFILTNLYGCLLKWCYRPKAYGDAFKLLFPGQKSVGTLYMLQSLELPYLFRIGNPDALLYANAFAAIIFPLMMIVMCESYFFPEVHHKRFDYWVFIPPAIVLLPLFLQATGVLALPEGYRPVTFCLVGALFSWYFWRTIRMGQRIGRAVVQVNEDTYADSDDFPILFAQKIQWLPTAISVFMAVSFILDEPLVKAIRDAIFTIVNIWFCIFTLNPWRKPFETINNSDYEKYDFVVPNEDSIPSKGSNGSDNSGFRLSSERYEELSRRLDQLLTDDRIFTEQHITIDLLVARLGTNSKYITEVIQRSGYSSFYDMVNQHRVRHAISLIRQYPKRRLGDIATDCGFSSPTSMNRAFANQGKPSPGTFRV